MEDARGPLSIEAARALGEGILLRSGLEDQPGRQRSEAVPGQAVGTGAQARLHRRLRGLQPGEVHWCGGSGSADQEYQQDDTAQVADLTQMRVFHFLPP